ncbi:MAG: hypothetical protein AB1609_13675 [Bacillota bacterium]
MISALAVAALGAFCAAGLARAGPFSLHGDATYRVDVPLEGAAPAAGTLRLAATGAGSLAPGLSAALAFDSTAPGYFPFLLATWESEFAGAAAGDFDVELPGAQLVRLNRQLRGVRISLGQQSGAPPGDPPVRPRLTVWASRVRSILWRDRFIAQPPGEDPPAGVKPVDPGTHTLPLSHPEGVEEPSISVSRSGALLRSGIDFQFNAGLVYLAEPLEDGERVEVEYRFAPAAAVPLQGAMAELQAPGGAFRVYRLGAPASPAGTGETTGSGEAAVPGAMTGLSWDVTAGQVHLELEHFRPDGNDPAVAWRWEAGADLSAVSVRYWHEQRAPGFPSLDDPDAVLYPQKEGMRLSLRPVPGWEMTYENQAKYVQVPAGLPIERRERYAGIAYRPVPPVLASVYYREERSFDPVIVELLRATEIRGAELRLPVQSIRLTARAERITASIPVTGSEFRDRWELAAERSGDGPVRWNLSHQDEVKRTEPGGDPVSASPDQQGKRRRESAASVRWTPTEALQISAEGSRMEDEEKRYAILRWSAGVGYAGRGGWNAGASLQHQRTAGSAAWANGSMALSLSGGYKGPPLTANLRVQLPFPAQDTSVPAVSVTAATPYGSTHQMDVQAAWKVGQAPQFTGTYRYSPGGTDRLVVKGSVTPLLFQVGEEEARASVEWYFSPHWILSAGWQRRPAPLAPIDGGVAGAAGSGPKEMASAALHYRF